MRESPVRAKSGRQLRGQPHRQTRQRASEAGDGKGAGSVLSPEIGMVVDIGQPPGNRGESRRCRTNGRQQSRERHGRQSGHHRGLRPGLMFTGVARELGIAVCLPAEKGRV